MNLALGIEAINNLSLHRCSREMTEGIRTVRAVCSVQCAAYV